MGGLANADVIKRGGGGLLNADSCKQGEGKIFQNLADVICERSHIETQFKVYSPISIKCMYEIAVLAKIFLKYVIYTVLLIFQERHPKFRTVYRPYPL